MTKIKQRIVEALDTVHPEEMLTLYSVVCGFTSEHTRDQEPRVPRKDVFMRVRKALGRCRGSLADDIHHMRGDRV